MGFSMSLSHVFANAPVACFFARMQMLNVLYVSHK